MSRPSTARMTALHIQLYRELNEKAEAKARIAPRRRFRDLAPLVWAALMTIAMLAPVALAAIGFFDWRPGDQAVSTIDYRLAPHLTSLERVKP
ncbi:MAG: hypothetical protein ACOVQ6_00590 [Brevundimonas sp.]